MPETQPTANNYIRPSRAWYWVALVLFLGGPLLGLISFLHSLSYLTYSHIDLKVPESNIITIQPQEKVTFQKKQQDKKYIILKAPGDYAIQIAKYPMQAKLIMLEANTALLIKSLICSLLQAIIGVLGGIVLAITVFIRRTNAKAKLTPIKSQTKKVIENDKQARIWAMLCHLTAITGFMVPFANIFVPLILWLVKKDEYDLVSHQGKQSLNFELSITIYYIIGSLLLFIFIGVFILPLIFLFHIIMIIIASTETAQGKRFRYPLAIPFLK